MHHTDLHLSTDPDLELYAIPNGAKHSGIAQLILQDLLWITALRRMLPYLRLAKTRAKPGNAAVLHLAAKLACQILLLAAACAIFGWRLGPVFYFFFWAVPLLSIFPAIVRFRIVTEHYSPDLIFNAGRQFVSRTTVAHRLETYLFGCDMEYHFEHHLFPAIPNPQLRKMHGTLLKSGFFERVEPQHPPESYVSDGYLRFWIRLLAGNVGSVDREIQVT